MGRGRQKAKQTKVARDLKYRSVETDFERLQRELRGEPAVVPTSPVDDDELEDDDEYAQYADLYADDDEDDDDDEADGPVQRTL